MNRNCLHVSLSRVAILNQMNPIVPTFSHSISLRSSFSFIMSVRPSAWKNASPSERIFIRFGISELKKKKLSRKFDFHQNMTIITGQRIYKFQSNITFICCNSTYMLCLTGVCIFFDIKTQRDDCN